MAGFSRIVYQGNPFLLDSGRTNAHMRSPATPAQERYAVVSASAAMDFTGYRQSPVTMPTCRPAPVGVIPLKVCLRSGGALVRRCPSVADQVRRSASRAATPTLTAAAANGNRAGHDRRPGKRARAMVVTPRSLLSGLAAGKFTDDVEVAGVAGVLLEQVEQDPLKGGGIRSVPPVARLANLSEVVGFNY